VIFKSVRTSFDVHSQGRARSEGVEEGQKGVRIYTRIENANVSWVKEKDKKGEEKRSCGTWKDLEWDSLS
jgi:hypothetical protein